jgi:murein DD-endopeptidase MepM/ murein hydrolase activator NlpD
LLVVLSCPARAEIPLGLEGQAAEGGLLIARTAPGAVVTLDGKPVRVSGAGDFLLGFGRDDAGTKRLVISLGGKQTARDIIVADRDFKIERIEGLPGKKVTPDPKALARIAQEKAAIEKAKQISDPSTSFLAGFRWPVTGRISGVYGSQRILNGKPRRPHYGTDVAAPGGTPVRAMSAGRVAFVHPGMFFNGKTVLIDHGMGLRSVYIHLSQTAVQAGDSVDAGQVIGAVGATGRATGPHLHFGLTLDQTPIDPELVLGEMPK